MRDVLTLRKCVWASLHPELHNGEPRRFEAQVLQSLFFCRLLLGILAGGYEFLADFSLVEKTFPGPPAPPRPARPASHSYLTDLDSEASAKLAHLASFFRQNRDFVRLVRSQMTFHYDVGRLGENVSRLDGDGALDLFFSEDHANAYYPFAEQTVVNAILARFARNGEPHDREETVLQFVSLLVELSNSLVDVLAELVSIFFRLSLGIEFSKANASSTFELTSVPRVDQLKLSAFLGSDSH